MSYSTEELVKIAQLYYIDQYTHSQIAEITGRNRIQITRMLKAARERKIVKITVENPDKTSYGRLSFELELRYNLSKAIVVPEKQDSDTDMLQQPSM